MRRRGHPSNRRVPPSRLCVGIPIRGGGPFKSKGAPPIPLCLCGGIPAEMGGHPSILLVVVHACVTATMCVRRCEDLRNLCGASLRGAKAPRPAPRPPGAPPPPRPAPRPPGAPPPPRPAPRPPGGVRAPFPTSRPAGDPRLPRPVRTLQALSLLRVQLCVLQALSQNMSGGMPQPRPNSDGGHYNVWVRVRSK